MFCVYIYISMYILIERKSIAIATIKAMINEDEKKNAVENAKFTMSAYRTAHTKRMKEG